MIERIDRTATYTRRELDLKYLDTLDAIIERLDVLANRIAVMEVRFGRIYAVFDYHNLKEPDE